MVTCELWGRPISRKGELLIWGYLIFLTKIKVKNNKE